MKTGTLLLRPLRPAMALDKLRGHIRYLNDSLRTEQAHVHRVRAVIRFHGAAPRNPGRQQSRGISVLIGMRAASTSTSRGRVARQGLSFGRDRSAINR